MARKRFREANCSVAQSLDRVGDWWTMLIIRDAFNGTTCFSDFQSSLGVAKNILSQRLAALVKDGIFERIASKPGVERYEYHLTDKGRDLMPLLVALQQWGDKWVFGPNNEPIVVMDSAQRQPIAPLEVRAADGRVLAHADLRAKAGPGADEETLARFARREAQRTKT